MITANTESDNTNVSVYSMRLAGYLMMNGFVLFAMAKNPHNERMNMFIFKDSPKLQQEIKQYLANK